MFDPFRALRDELHKILTEMHRHRVREVEEILRRRTGAEDVELLLEDGAKARGNASVIKAKPESIVLIFTVNAIDPFQVEPGMSNIGLDRHELDNLIYRIRRSAQQHDGGIYLGFLKRQILENVYRRTREESERIIHDLQSWGLIRVTRRKKDGIGEPVFFVTLNEQHPWVVSAGPEITQQQQAEEKVST